MAKDNKELKSNTEKALESAAKPTEDQYPDWDKERHLAIKGAIRFVGPGGNIMPQNLFGPHWTDPRVQKQVCHGLDQKKREVWKYLPDEPHPAFVGLQASGEDDDLDDAPIPYDYELPSWADASTIEVSNFDQGNPTGVETRKSHDPDELESAMKAFESYQPHDDERPAVA